jgi:uncharacterized protein
MAPPNGKFVWYELMTDNPTGAETFYKSIMGWTTRDFGGPENPYTLLATNGQDMGGLMQLPEEARKMGARPGWMGYIGVPDINARAQRVKEAGGYVHREPWDIPTVGRIGVFADPHGAVFCMITPEMTGDPPPPVPPGTPGHTGWHELHAGDREEDYAFYANLFGWTKAEAHDMGPMGIYQLFATGAQPVGGMMTKTKETPAPFWLYYFNVGNIDEAATRVAAAGGKILNGPHEVPGGSWILQGQDPQGAMFALVGSRS